MNETPRIITAWAIFTPKGLCDLSTMKTSEKTCKDSFGWGRQDEVEGYRCSKVEIKEIQSEAP